MKSILWIDTEKQWFLIAVPILRRIEQDHQRRPGGGRWFHDLLGVLAAYSP